jgi:hypothetical protein
MNFAKKIVLAPLMLASVAHAAEEKSLEKRVEELEFASYSNTLKWSGFFQSRYDSLTYKPENGKDEKLNLHRMLGGIDFSANPNDRISVFGRLTFAKFYNNRTEKVLTSGQSLTASRRYVDDGQVKVERFFLNYKLLSDLTLSLGRLPTMDGPPQHIYDGRSRLGSYPSQLYSTALDGYALSYAPKISENQSLSFRYILSPLTNIGQVAPNSTQWKYYDGQVAAGRTKKSEDVRDISSWMADYSISGTAIARNINVIYQGLQLNKLGITDSLALSLKRHTVYFELNDIASSGLTFYLSESFTNIKSDGSQIVGVNPATGAPIVVALLSNKADDTAKGSGSIIGLNLTLPLETSLKPAIGAEFVKGSEKYINFDSSTDQPFAYYDLRGNGYQFYYTQPLAAGFTVRVGYQAAKADYTSALLGAPLDNKDEMTSIYGNLRVDF